MKTFRTVLFWLHLACGLAAGAVIGLLCLTGTGLAFERQLVAWAERDAQHLPPAEATGERLPLADLIRQAQAAKPAARLTGVTLAADPQAAVTLNFGRDDLAYAHPVTGVLRVPQSTAMRDAMHRLESWHRYLALSGEQRPLGKAVTGAANLIFCFLALSGLYLWWPRTWRWVYLKAVVWPRLSAGGKARDFSWHNAVGLWCAPVLIVLTLTAVPISYRWGGDLLYRAVGETPPPPGPPASPPRPLGAHPLSLDALVASVQQAYPQWQTITVRLAAGREPADSPTATTFVVRQSGAWPRTATTAVTVDPNRGHIVRAEGHADLSPGRRLRTWTRFLHTGEALGPAGQAIAALACVGGCILVYTGCALAWRRFAPRAARGTGERS